MESHPLSGRLRAVRGTPFLALAGLLFALPAGLAGQEVGQPLDRTPEPATRTPTTVSQDPDGFLFAPPVVRLGMRFGFNFARAASGVFDLATDELTLDRGDFGGFAVGGDLAIRVTDPIDIVLSATHVSSSSKSEFREWEDGDGLPITQRTTFSQTPLTASARFYLMPRGRRIGRFAWVPAKFSPYVGAGGGWIHYQFKQNGSFVDFVDLSIFDATLQSSGWAPVGIVNGGADISLNQRVTFNADVRYQFASADLEQDFISFTDGIDLNGLQLSVGVHFRF